MKRLTLGELADLYNQSNEEVQSGCMILFTWLLDKKNPND
jgi:hypothetical protein